MISKIIDNTAIIERDKEGNFIFYEVNGKTFFTLEEARKVAGTHILSAYVPIFRYVYSKLGDPNGLIRKERIY